MIGSFKCKRCKNVLNPTERTLDLKCKAFPEGIPELKIAYIHTDPCVDCNDGIGFEPKEETED